MIVVSIFKENAGVKNPISVVTFES